MGYKFSHIRSGLTFGEAIAHGNAIMRLGMKAKDFGVE
jgi:hypothetical protein